MSAINEVVARVGEMAAQASLGHKRFCVGIHDYGELGTEEEWVDWSDAFAPILAHLATVEAERDRLRAEVARLRFRDPSDGGF